MKVLFRNFLKLFVIGSVFLNMENVHAQGTCATATVIASLPYSKTGVTNCGNGSNYSATPACLTAQYFAGEDYVFVYTPNTNQCIDAAALFATGSTPYNSGLAVLNNCPTTAGATCVASDVKPTGATSLIVKNVSLTAGTTYYFVISGGQNILPFFPGVCFGFDFQVQLCQPPPTPAYTGVSCGLNFVHAEALVQKRSAVAAPPFNATGTGFPSSVTISGLAPCYVIDAAYLYFTSSYYTVLPPVPSMSFTNPSSSTNNFSPVMVGSGGDKCWGETGTAVYRATVTSSIGGNGTYSFNITGFPKAGVEDAYNDVDGASLIIVYHDPTATYQGSLTLWDGALTCGNSNAVQNPQTHTLTGFNACATTTANAFLIVADMQANINGGFHNTTLNGQTNAYPNNFWNFDQKTVTINSGQTTSQFAADGMNMDCYTIALTGLYYQTTSCVTCSLSQPTLSVKADTTALCALQCTNVIASTSAGSFNYTWTPNIGIGAGPFNVCPSSTTTYSAVAISGCDTLRQSVTINVSPCSLPPVAHFTSSDTAFCDEGGKCIDFTDHSTGNPTNWKWTFAGAQPDTSTAQNPTGICYYIPGSYQVTLVITSATGSDSVKVTPHIVFASGAAAPVITRNGDTLFCSHEGSYQWYFNGTMIPGATDSFYVGMQDGSYSVYITDDNGCSRLGNPVTFVGLSNISGNSPFEIYPNPAGNQFTVYGLTFTTGKVIIDIYNVLGEKVYSYSQLQTTNSQLTINSSSFAKGVYVVQLTAENKTYRMKVVKE